jgi:hypothetical protein
MYFLSCKTCGLKDPEVSFGDRDYDRMYTPVSSL